MATHRSDELTGAGPQIAVVPLVTPPPAPAPVTARRDGTARLRAFLEAPLSGPQCALGWCAATVLFVGILALLGGPGSIDTSESVYSTWAVAHGQLACTYPAASLPGEPLADPLYPFVSGGIAAVARVGHGVAFPSTAALGPGCRRMFETVGEWSLRSGALRPTQWIGCVAWLALMAGVVALLRAAGRGRRGWEPVTLAAVACLPPVWMCLQSTFHPQDLLALGLALGAVAAACRGRWAGAGILVALAVLSQQFALLVAVPLLVLAPARRRPTYAGAAIVTWLVAVVPLVVVTSGHALRPITLGTGDSPSVGGTVLWELHRSGAQGVVLSRVAPLVLAAALAWWVGRRLGPVALEPQTLLCVVALALGLRLVFEQNLFAYYFMALAVSLLLLDVVRGRVRASLVAWLAAVTIVFCVAASPAFAWVSWGERVRSLVPLCIVLPALAVLLVRTLRTGFASNMVPWLGVAACALLTWPGRSGPTGHGIVTWLWQVLLVLPGLAFAAGPLRERLRQSDQTTGIPRTRRISRT